MIAPQPVVSPALVRWKERDVTLAEREETETLGKAVCAHDERAVCYLCSDQDPRWREWRIRMGLPAEPPNKRLWVVLTPEEELRASRLAGLVKARIAKAEKAARRRAKIAVWPRRSYPPGAGYSGVGR